jgi:uncharacterized membrane protein YhaH (DUF805 family)
MSFVQAVSSGFANYFNFRGRALRSEYWYFVLFLFVAGLAVAAADLVVFGSKQQGLLSAIFSLAVFIPSLSVGVRRLHDTGRSGWFLLVVFIPLIGFILLIYWACQPSKPEANEYGSPTPV